MLLASVGLALDWADTQAAHADQGGLFDFGDGDMHGASTQEPALVAAEPWSIKERLTLEKAALGFYLSGHLFDQSAAEVRRFAKRRDRRPDRQRASRSCSPASSATCASSTASAAGSRSSSSTTRARRSRRWPTRSCSTPTASCCKDDELVIVQGKVQPDRFSGGVRLNVQQVWDLAGARCRFGKYLRVEVNGSVPPVAEVLRDFPSRRVADRARRACRRA